MRGRNSVLIFVILFALFFLQQNVTAQTETETRIAQLEKDVGSLKSKVTRLFSNVDDKIGPALVMYFFGIFCALWAQNTGRSAVGWFFAGLFFSIFTVLILLEKNSNDLKKNPVIR